MSKIIEKGNKQYECKCCGCKFEIENGDIDYEMPSNAFWSNGYYFARCPQCNSKVKVDYNNSN